jgi:hypothetical protein
VITRKAPEAPAGLAPAEASAPIDAEAVSVDEQGGGGRSFGDLLDDGVLASDDDEI